MANSNPLSITDVALQLGKRVTAKQTNTQAAIDAMGDSPSPQDMMQLQAMFTDYQVFAQLNSGLIKEIGDTLKSIVQKMA